MKTKRTKPVKERVAATKDVTAKNPRKKVPVFNLLVVLLFWVVTVSVFYSGRLIQPQELVLGQQAPETLVASVDFSAETLSATELKQREEAQKILPVFTLSRDGITEAEEALSKLLPRLRSLQNTDDPERRALIEDSVKDRLDWLSIPLDIETLVDLLPAEDIDLKAVILSALNEPIAKGIISEMDRNSRFNSIVENGNITVRQPEAEVIRPLNDFALQEDVLQNAVKIIAAQLPREKRNERAIRTLVKPWLKPNLSYDSKETAARRTQAVELVDPVLESVPRGSLLIRSGDLVDEQTLVWLAAHQERLGELETPMERIQRLGASGLLLLAGLGLTAAIAATVCPKLVQDRRKVLLLMTVSILPILFGKLLTYLTVNLHVLPQSILNYAVPLAVGPILASVLAGGTAGILVGIWISFALSALLGNSFDVFILGLLVTVTAVGTTRDVKRRAALFRAGLWVGAIKIFAVLVLAVLNQPSWQVLFPQLGTALVSGLISALAAMLLIPVFEHLFGITTDIKLLELSDLSHPLLQSLAINAPGTYHHSLMMASLAQNAAEAIGANGLMLRVCAYFHDIGKLVKPGFFSENIQFTENPHDELAPSMSTLVIVAHIKEGVTLAKKHKLPQVIIDGIEQHQGTSLVTVFYHRAKTQQQDADGNGQPSNINDEDFRYEGPKPQNREMAILMLADSCEAASRSLDKPTSGRIRNLLMNIFDARLRDGQLDECNLTFAELTAVRESFVFSLTNMLHGRVAYPKDENSTSQSTEQAPAQPKSDSNAD